MIRSIDVVRSATRLKQTGSSGLLIAVHSILSNLPIVHGLISSSQLDIDGYPFIICLTAEPVSFPESRHQGNP